MKSESPLVPQGSFLERKNKGQARTRIAIFVVLAVHCAGVMALLMQGCKKPAGEDSPASPSETNTLASPPSMAAPTFEIPTNQYAAEAYQPPSAPPASDSADAPVAIAQEMPHNNASDISQPSNITEHKVVRGDTFGKLAKHYGVTANAIQEANPGVTPKNIKIDSTLRIPAPVASASVIRPSTQADSGAAGNSSGMRIHKVKSGDTLSRIARNYGVTRNAIRTANKMKTDRILVDQPLKIPSTNPPASSTP